jgi:hypothetical protein
MKCERCGASMLEEQITVSGGMVKLKNISAWTCTECERVEYGTMRSLAATVNTAARQDISG